MSVRNPFGDISRPSSSRYSSSSSSSSLKSSTRSSKTDSSGSKSSSKTKSSKKKEPKKRPLPKRDEADDDDTDDYSLDLSPEEKILSKTPERSMSSSSSSSSPPTRVRKRAVVTPDTSKRDSEFYEDDDEDEDDEKEKKKSKSDSSSSEDSDDSQSGSRTPTVDVNLPKETEIKIEEKGKPGKVHRENVISILSNSYDYRTVGVVKMSNKSGKKTVLIKAISPTGILVYVSFRDDMVYTMNNDSVYEMNEEPEAEFIPVSVSNALYEETSKYVDGAIVVCENGVCTLQRNQDDPESMDEQKYVVTGKKKKIRNISVREKSGSSYVSDRDGFTAHPIVRLEDIIKSPLSTIANIAMANLSILNQTKLSCEASLDEYNESYIRLTKASKLLVKRMELVQNVLSKENHRDRTRLYRFINNLESKESAVTDPEFLRTTSKTVERDLAIMSINKYCAIVDGFTEKILEMTDELDSMSDILQKELDREK